MRKIHLIVILLFGCINCFAQDISGHWTGELPQNNTLTTLKLEADIVQNGNKLSGHATYTSSDGHFVAMAFRGSITGDKVTMNEYRADSCNCTTVWHWCMKKMDGTLTTDAATKSFTIAGRWHSDTAWDGNTYTRSDCLPGRFTMHKGLPLAVPVIAKTQVQQSLPPLQKLTKQPQQPPRPRTFFIITPIVDTDKSPLDGYYVKTTVKSATPTAYPSLREADVVFAKRVWREIDLRERMNQYLVAPRSRLIDVLMTAIMTGQLVAYDASPNAAKDDPNGDEFKTPISPDAAKAKMSDSSLVYTFDKDGNKTGSRRVAGEFNPDSILRFRIKEDWVFDKQRSVLEPRIIGIAPLVRPKAGNTLLDYQPAFWINFPEARKVLASKPIIMRHNDATTLSFDQAFLKRIFDSYIVKQSNERDERIKDYTQGIDQLREAERIKKAMMDYELTLWQY